MGTDLTVVNAARVSFAKVQEDLQESDKGLINYLAKHNHWTPFAHAQITLRVTAPVPIRTQCFKHKQGFVENEESRRYISGTPKIYYPEIWRKKPEGSAKQGSEGVHDMSQYWGAVYKNLTDTAVHMYDRMIEDGVAPEQARLVLPQGAEVSWYWTGSLAAYARFCKQRSDSHAQVEIQELAATVSTIIEQLYPMSWKALTDG
jgi:thymidylate synthase (FAD)